jgi:putative peptide zinc metalloprotease protein
MPERTLYSNSWYRVAELKPSVRSHAEIHRHTYRGRAWYILQDHSTGRFHRFSEESYFIIGLMDGKRSLQEIWEAACEKLGDDMPTQDEMITLLSQLHQADVLQSDTIPDTDSLQRRHQRGRSAKFWNTLRSPLAVRLPIMDPDRFLEKTKGFIRPLFSFPAALIWLFLVITAVSLTFIHWEELTSNLADRVFSLENLLIFWLIYPVVKALHECGHAYAVKRWGGEVHEMGIMFIVFIPIPYLDASAASAFREKGRRIFVGAAGIAVELLIASLAMILWVNAEIGVVRAVAYNTMVVAGLSTLFFNGNPLLRFDAYYVLSDFLEIPNLGIRANRYLGYLAQRYLIRNDEAEFFLSDGREAFWLILYGLASFAYRIFITLQIALFVAGSFFFVGVLIALWAVIGLFFVPLFKVLRLVITHRELYKRRWRVLALGLILGAFLVFFVTAVPFPSFTIAEGILWPGEQARIHTDAKGVIREILVKPGTKMKKGDPLIRCENFELASKVKLLEADLREYEARQKIAQIRDRTEEKILGEEIVRIGKELVQAKERLAALVIRSPISGVFLLPQAEDMPGRFLQRGGAVGYVVDYSNITVRVVVPQAEVDRIRTNVRSVTSRLAEAISVDIPSELVREVPAASSDLPSLALSLPGGGSFALDPRENKSPRSFERLFHFEVRLPGETKTRIGERVYVRFEHDPESLSKRWYRTVRQLFLKRFNV